MMGDESTSGLLGAKINNPYSTEYFERDPDYFFILWYYTDVNQADGMVTRDELTPIIFKNGEAVGYGWNYYNQAKHYGGSNGKVRLVNPR